MSSSRNQSFSNDFSKAIADALHDKETNLQKEKEDHSNLVRDAYVALCYDEPRVESDEACRLLAKQLLDGQRYALSERLVEGIRQATSRIDIRQERPKEDDPKPDRDNDNQPTDIETEAGLSTIGQGYATAEGYAILAFTVFCRIPLKCFEAPDLKDVQRLLGSYRGGKPKDDIHEKLQALHLNEKAESIQVQKDSKLNMDTKLDVNFTPPYSNEMDTEIWADESDPSDFVFESDAVDWKAWEQDFKIDPEDLSQPIYNDSLTDVQHALSNLLQNVTHDKFVPFTSILWNRYGCADALTRLTLLLLIDEKNPLVKGLQRWSIQPINVFRDRLLLDHNKDCLKDYLTLIQSLLAVDAAQDSHLKLPIANASMVGLASLSSICSQAKVIREVPSIRKCVLECCEDLSSLVEHATALLENQTDSSSHWWVSMIWALLPLMELLANIQANGTSLETSGNAFIPSSGPQYLLNSGFFRSLILLYTKSAPYSSLVANPARHQLLQCLQMLSLQSMSLLGKYAWRVPELSALIHCKDFTRNNNTVDALIWSLMGQDLAGGGSVLRLRNVTPITSNDCKLTAIHHWECLIEQLFQAIQQIRNFRMRKLNDNSTSHHRHDHPTDEWKLCMSEFVRFTNCLVSCPALPPLWRQATDPDIVMTKQLSDIQRDISNLPSFSVSTKSTSTAVKSSDNDKARDPLEHSDPSYSLELDQIRKGIKVIQSSYYDAKECGSARSLASKTD
jgi:hypothetical protein